MNTRRLALLSLILAAVMPLAHAAQDGMPARAQSGLLVDPAGMTLYVFDKDMPGSGKSACTGPCATNWPAFQAMAGAEGGGDYGVIVRDDGSRQWTYKGKPLYRWIKDQKPGDMTGDGFRDIWHAARP